MTVRRFADLLALGALWGLAAYLLGHKAFGAVIWAGVIAAPAIGVVVGSSTQLRFERAVGRWRTVWALVSLYVGATLFAVVIGFGTWAAVSSGFRRLPITLFESLISVWWGVTLTGFWLVLWPLAYVSHRWLEWRGTR